jgi:hypothetical protein
MIDDGKTSQLFEIEVQHEYVGKKLWLAKKKNSYIKVTCTIDETKVLFELTPIGLRVQCEKMFRKRM